MVARSDLPLDRARTLAQEALREWRGSDPDRAIEALDHALALLLPVGSSDSLADVLRWKGSVLRDRGSHSAASDLYAQSLSVADSVGYTGGRAHAFNCLGTIAQVRGDLSAAERWYGEAARLAHRLGDRRLSGMVQQNLGIVADIQGRTDEAVAHFRLALAAFEQEDQLDAALAVLNNLGVLYTREGAYARATEVLDRALSLTETMRDVASQGIVLENRAKLFLVVGQHSLAEAAANRAYDIAEERRDNTRRAAAYRVLGLVARARDGSTNQVVTHLERALVLCEMGEDVQLRAEILSDLGDACSDAGQLTRARECWRRSLELVRLAGLGGMIGPLQSKLRTPSVERMDVAHEVRP